jgi:hypothetical protein
MTGKLNRTLKILNTMVIGKCFCMDRKYLLYGLGVKIKYQVINCLYRRVNSKGFNTIVYCIATTPK